MSQAVARRYARAIFELGRESGKLRELVVEFGRFAELYAASAELRELDRNPALGDSERGKIIEELGRRLGASLTLVRSVTMLATRQRLVLLPDLVVVLGEMSDEHEGLLRVQVLSAAPLSTSYVARLTRTLEAETGKKVVLALAEDRALLAGVVVRIGDRVIDGSIKGRLARLTESLRTA
ncbi:MAG: ATP synthase F1 subunit delta [Myxococcales bacterium]|nr:ATP synthase F1 subunit delta [Myxococcales bacterium]